MLEILLSMAIFAIGFAMVATIFPSAIFLQKQTADAVQGRVMEDNIASLLAGRKFQLADVQTLANSTSVQAWTVAASSMTDTDPTNDVWTAADRSYPSTQVDLTKRRYYWVPLFRKINSTPIASTSASDWTVYVFVLQADGRTTATDGSSIYERLPALVAAQKYANMADGWTDGNSNNTADATPTDTYSCPGVFSEPGTSATSTFSFTNTVFNAGLKYLRPGDQVLDNNGNIYTIATADPTGASVTVQGDFATGATALWLAQPPAFDAVSPVLRILTITGDNCIQ